MKTIMALLIFFLLCSKVNAQLIPNPKYSFEHLRFHSKMSAVKNKYSNFTPAPIDDKTKKMMAGYGDDYILLRYYDSTLYKNGILSISFTKKDSSLNSVQFIIALSANTESSEYETVCNSLWEETIKRFGEPTAEKNIPLFGKIRKWEIENIAVSAMKTESGFRSLTLSYSIKE